MRSLVSPQNIRHSSIHTLLSPQINSSNLYLHTTTNTRPLSSPFKKNSRQNLFVSSNQNNILTQIPQNKQFIDKNAINNQNIVIKQFKENISDTSEEKLRKAEEKLTQLQNKYDILEKMHELELNEIRSVYSKNENSSKDKDLNKILSENSRLSEESSFWRNRCLSLEKNNEKIDKNLVEKIKIDYEKRINELLNDNEELNKILELKMNIVQDQKEKHESENLIYKDEQTKISKLEKYIKELADKNEILINEINEKNLKNEIIEKNLKEIKEKNNLKTKEFIEENTKVQKLIKEAVERSDKMRSELLKEEKINKELKEKNEEYEKKSLELEITNKEKIDEIIRMEEEFVKYKKNSSEIIIKLEKKIEEFLTNNAKLNQIVNLKENEIKAKDKTILENQEKQSKAEIIIEEQNEKMVYFQEKIVETDEMMNDFLIKKQQLEEIYPKIDTLLSENKRLADLQEENIRNHEILIRENNRITSAFEQKEQELKNFKLKHERIKQQLDDLNYIYEDYKKSPLKIQEIENKFREEKSALQNKVFELERILGLRKETPRIIEKNFERDDNEMKDILICKENENKKLMEIIWNLKKQLIEKNKKFDEANYSLVLSFDNKD